MKQVSSKMAAGESLDEYEQPTLKFEFSNFQSAIFQLWNWSLNTIWSHVTKSSQMLHNKNHHSSTSLFSIWFPLQARETTVTLRQMIVDMRDYCNFLLKLMDNSRLTKTEIKWHFWNGLNARLLTRSYLCILRNGRRGEQKWITFLLQLWRAAWISDLQRWLHYAW